MKYKKKTRDLCRAACKTDLKAVSKKNGDSFFFGSWRENPNFYTICNYHAKRVEQ